MTSPGPFACTISGPNLLQTEHILLKHSPELMPFIRQIRSRGEVNIYSPQDASCSSFNMYTVDLPKEACRLILGIAQRVETECKGHPAFTRELVTIWKQITERAT